MQSCIRTYGVSSSCSIVTPAGLCRVGSIKTPVESHVGRGILPNTCIESIGMQEAKRVFLMSGASFVVPASAVCGPVGELNVGDTMCRVIGPYYYGPILCEDEVIRKFIQILNSTPRKSQHVMMDLTKMLSISRIGEAELIFAWLCAAGYDAQLEYHGYSLLATYWPTDRGLVDDTVSEVADAGMQPMYTISSTAGDEACVNGVLVRTN